MTFQAYKEDGSILFDTKYITYGLRRSGYLSLVSILPRYEIRSVQLDPNDPSSYYLTAPIDPIFGFSVTGAVAPAVFIEGSGVYIGSSYENGVTTFMFICAGPNTKFFYFDTMRDFPISAGLKTYADDAANSLTFNSVMVPLDIDYSGTFPPPSAEVPGWPGTVTSPFVGSTAAWSRPSGMTAYTSYYTMKLYQPVGPGTYAALTTFSRGYQMGRQDSMGTPVEAGADRGLAFTYASSAIDGAFGGPGGFYFMCCDAPRAPMNFSIYGAGGFINVPRDRLPNALVVRSDTLPFPYSVG